MGREFQRLKYGCYMSNVCMSIVSAFIPLLFLAFRQLYNFSYTSLGALVLINFVSQLLVDLLYSFFSSKLNIELSVRLMPVIMLIGMLVLATAPFIFSTHIYLGIVIGVVIISASSGIAEVLNSRVIAAIPSKDPDKEMSALHSIFAFGVVGCVIVCSIFLKLFSNQYWWALALILCIVPIINIILYIKQPFPRLVEDEDGKEGGFKSLLSPGFLLSVLCIFLGAASENIMSQWSSGYIERALGVPKIYGDIFGVAMFALCLGLGRSLYAKIGKKITLVLIIGSFSALVCYILASTVLNPIVGIVACAISGFAVAMLWPGNIIVASSKYLQAGTAMFALLAAGGDLGGSIGPQIMGALTDCFMENQTLINYAISSSISLEQVAMRVALLCVGIFPLLSFIFTIILHFTYKNVNK